MMRGNNREYIFGSESHKNVFMELLNKEAEEGLIGVAAWCLMDNHVHLVLKGKLADISAAIKRINIKFAMGFNYRLNRIGHVFQDRYKSEVILDDTHLLAVVRYVHNNPVKARMAAESGAYQWSSYQQYVQNSGIIGTGQRALIMGYFAGNIEAFEAFHRERDDNEYLEIKEDVEKLRMERAQEIIEAFCRANGISEAGELSGIGAGMQELISELLTKSKVSHRKIAGLLGVSASRVHQASREND